MTKTAVAIRHVAFEDVGLWREPPRRGGLSALAIVRPASTTLGDAELALADLLIVLGGPIGVYETDAYPFLVEEIAPVRRRLEARSRSSACASAPAHGGGARRARRAGQGQGDRLCAGRADRGRPRLAARALDGLPVLHWHGDCCDLPEGAERLASTKLCPVQAFRLGPAALGLQFHVEADPTGSSLARRPHGRARQGRTRSARPARRGAAHGPAVARPDARSSPSGSGRAA